MRLTDQSQDEVGNENWGKAVKCDAPHYYPNVRFYWVRDYWPNQVEEDRRIMVSHDGYIYFSALENIDRGNYSCFVQSTISSQGRIGGYKTFFHALFLFHSSILEPDFDLPL